MDPLVTTFPIATGNIDVIVAIDVSRPAATIDDLPDYLIPVTHDKTGVMHYVGINYKHKWQMLINADAIRYRVKDAIGSILVSTLSNDYTVSYDRIDDAVTDIVERIAKDDAATDNRPIMGIESRAGEIQMALETDKVRLLVTTKLDDPGPSHGNVVFFQREASFSVILKDAPGLKLANVVNRGALVQHIENNLSRACGTKILQNWAFRDNGPQMADLFFNVATIPTKE